MNSNLAKLQPYPFEKLRVLFDGVNPDSAYQRIELHIGEPKHPTPEFIKRAMIGAMAGLAQYPATAGTPALREAIAQWLQRRYHLPKVDPATQILPINGSREALFAIAQLLVETRLGGEPPLVISPNPFYQIYEGAALLAGAEPYFVNAIAENGFATDYGAVPDDVWRRVQLVFTCSPGNPSGRVMTLADWKLLFELSDRYGFVIASDECYSELYFDETLPPLGGLEAANRLGRPDFSKLLVFSSLSKRSNVPGMRSGFVAGDARLIKPFLLYRTYHGSAMSATVQTASVAAWNDETHVVENRRIYAAKFKAVRPLIQPPLVTTVPEAGFYFWVRTPIEDTRFARDFLEAYNVTVLPGSFLAREAQGSNPGRNHIRLALVAPIDECVEAAQRLGRFAERYR
ncbi:MAG: succinyldiaminopimelate transaminase [Betaproteobacteria bacterium RIFCSPLOWO2_02_FULL_62_17]|nr:MAG: succinyldiaminopimelate transaminase [Betaproteobacteria bacterium RIFCSPLOWO2_02_FULL_62_17]